MTARLALLLALLAAPAVAEEPTVTPCGSSAVMRETLQVRYREQPTAYGPTADGKRLVTLLRNVEDDTWTITATIAGGITCMVAAGKGWTALPDGEPS